MREITTHKVNGLNEVLRIVVLDGPGQGNACHNYQIEPFEEEPTINEPERITRITGACCFIRFQNGPINEAGVNGISNEALLAIVRDRLEGFQGGKFACDENRLALEHIIDAMDSLNSRTGERINRGVEGTNVV